MYPSNSVLPSHHRRTGRITALWLFVGALALGACGEDNGDTAETSSDSGETGETGDSGTPDLGDGVTACGNFGGDEVYCEAGQFCNDSVLADCRNGCLSNKNCASDQQCIKADGVDEGTCQSEPKPVSCEPVCTKLMACDPNVSQAMCDQFCAGVSDACKLCVADANCSDETACQSECGG